MRRARFYSSILISLIFSGVAPFDSLAAVRSESDSNCVSKFANLSERSAQERKFAPLGAPVPPSLLKNEIDALVSDRPSAILAQYGPYEVISASYGEIPSAMKELGRLREITFRAVGEGTGKALDLDSFDQTYQHIFVWNREKSEIVGAYRIGKIDELLKKKGIDGIYSSQFFKYDRAFFSQPESMMEAGRAFIRPEYQGSKQGLPLLWKGIMTYIAQNPRYHIMIGPLSIPNVYKPESTRLMLDYLSANFLDPQLSKLVRPSISTDQIAHVEAETRANLLEKVTNLATLNTEIMRMEDGKIGVPPLVKQYLHLGGKVASFNFDPKFNSVDCALIIDLWKIPPREMRHFMDEESFNAYIRNGAAQIERTGAKP